MPDFTMFAGDSKRLEVTVQDESGAPVDLSGAQAIRWQLSKTPRSRPRLIEKSLTSGITITDAPAGRFDVALAPADTLALRGDYYHEAELIDGAGNVSTVISGAATITPALIDPV